MEIFINDEEIRAELEKLAELYGYPTKQLPDRIDNEDSQIRQMKIGKKVLSWDFQGNLFRYMSDTLCLRGVRRLASVHRSFWDIFLPFVDHFEWFHPSGIPIDLSVYLSPNPSRDILDPRVKVVINSVYSDVTVDWTGLPRSAELLSIVRGYVGKQFQSDVLTDAFCDHVPGFADKIHELVENLLPSQEVAEEGNDEVE